MSGSLNISDYPFSMLRATRATANIPQSTTYSVFTILNGRIMLIQIVGEVTTVIETQANATKLVSNPTTGSSEDMCATLDITADEAATLYGITGTVSDALVGVDAGLVESQGKALILPVGTIDLVCAASNTGQVKWEVWYVPLDAGALVVSA